MSRFETALFEYISNVKQFVRSLPLNLGGIAGAGGGLGGPPGGFIGYLPQTRVAYDTTEAETMATAVSGSLLDNMNHIRKRLDAVEIVASGNATYVDIYQDGALVSEGVTLVDFYNADVVETAPGEVTVTCSGGGGGTSVDVYQDAVLKSEDITSIDFYGASVVETLPGKVSVTIDGGGTLNVTTTFIKTPVILYDNTLTLPASDISISGIPAGYESLKLEFSSGGGYASDYLHLELNDETDSGGYYYTEIVASGVSITSSMDNGTRIAPCPRASATGTLATIIEFPNYDTDTSYAYDARRTIFTRALTSSSEISSQMISTITATVMTEYSPITKIKLLLEGGEKFHAGTKVSVHAIGTTEVVTGVTLT
jgi:hypothetical protein